MATPRSARPGEERCAAKTLVKDDRYGGWLSRCERPHGHRGQHFVAYTGCEPVAALRWSGRYNERTEAV